MAVARWSRRLGAWWPPAVLVLLVALVLVLLASRLAGSPNRPARPVLVASGDWEPFVGSDLTGGGPVTELVTEVLQRQGYAPEVRYTTFSLALQRTAQQSVIGSYPFVGSAERRSDFLLSDKLLDFQYVLFVRADDAAARIDDAADLAGLRVARIEGYDYWPELNDAVAAQTEGYLPYASKEAAFDALAAGEVDVVPEGLLSGDAVLTSPDFTGDAGAITHVDPGTNPLLGSVEALYFMVEPSRANEEFIASFDRQLAEVKKTELYDQVVSAIAEQEGDGTVTLQPLGDDGLVRLRDGGGRTVLTPTGTAVRVVEWPPEFSQGVAGDPATDIDVQVKVLDGPARGRILTVDARSLVLGSAS